VEERREEQLFAGASPSIYHKYNSGEEDECTMIDFWTSDFNSPYHIGLF
jgi:hypothetical protein